MRYDFNTPILDAPDATVRRASIKAQLGIAPTNQELDRLGGRMRLEERAAQGLDAPNSAAYRRNFDFNGAPRAGAPGLLSILETAADSARNPSPIAGETPGVLSMLRGSRLDPLQSRRAERRQRLEAAGLALQVSAEQRRQQQDAQRIKQNQTNDAAARAALAPVTALPDPGAVAEAFNSNGSLPIPQATTREPTGDEILRNYITAGGQAEPSLLVAAAKPQRQARNVTVIPLQDASGATVNFAWDGANLQRIDAKPETPTPGAGGVDVIDVPGVGKIAVDARTRAPIDAGKVIKPAKPGKGLDPMLIGTISEQIQTLETERLQHQQAVAGGDNRFGFANVSKRQDRLREIDARLAGLRATLEAGPQDGEASPARLPAETTKPSATKTAAAPAPKTGAKAPKSFAAETYKKDELLTEAKRRGLIK